MVHDWIGIVSISVNIKTLSIGQYRQENERGRRPVQGKKGRWSNGGGGGDIWRRDGAYGEEMMTQQGGARGSETTRRWRGRATDRERVLHEIEKEKAEKRGWEWGKRKKKN